MSTIYVDVDTQVDFCAPGGALFVPGAPGAMGAITALVRHAEAGGLTVLGSVDSHEFDAWEFKRNGRAGPSGEPGLWPAHCVKGSEGWLKMPGTTLERSRFVPNVPEALATLETARHYLRGGPQALYFEKEVYSLFANPLAARVLDALAEGGEKLSFVVFGVATDYCVKAAALGLAAWQRGRGEPVDVAVVTDAMGAVDVQPGDGQRALEAMLSAGCQARTASEVLGAAR